MWLYEASTALFPSAYLKYHWLTPAQRYNLVYGRVYEGRRISKAVGKARGTSPPVYIYQRFRFKKDLAYYSKVRINICNSVLIRRYMH